MAGFIHTNRLYKIYRMGDERIHALHDVSLDIERGERVCVLGTSGSGKSTLLNMLAGLEPPTQGDIIIGGIPISSLTEDQLTSFRALHIGFVFQSYNLIPTLSALENVSLGLTFKGIPRAERIKMAAKMLSDVGLADRLHHRPKELSGGQQQRVSIARAFVGNPKIVFADEPTGNLDSRTSEEVMQVISHLTEIHRQTLIIVTHDQQIGRYCERTLKMKDGRIDEILLNKGRPQ